MAYPREDLGYKTDDHHFRSRDEYAQGKYDITTRWLAPHITRGQVLLNIGCGSGEYSAKAASLGLDVIACEPEPRAFELARAAAPAGCEVRNCGLLELRGTTPAADFLVMHDVLEHIDDDVTAVEVVRSLLKPGGLAVISVPALSWLFGHHDEQLGHFRRYTRRSLLPLFRDGFHIETSRYYGAAFIPVTFVISRVLRAPYPTAAASDGLGRRAMRLLCQAESRVGMPVGTSLLLRVRRR